MNERVLVVGATGMLGEPVARALHDAGYGVRVLSRTPEKAREKFGEAYEVVEGDVERPASLESALGGCYGVHVNLSGGPRLEDYERIEHRGTANVANAAAKAGIRRMTYLSGTSVSEEHAWLPLVSAKLRAEEAIRARGVPYSIFRATWFMESLPLFVRGGRATVIGKKAPQYRWVAAKDYARMVATSYGKAEAANKVFFVYGPESLGVEEALRRYCAAVHPGMSVSVVPSWFISLIGTVTMNAALKDVASFMRYCERLGGEMEPGDPTEANNLLGAPEATLDRWIAGRRRTT